MGSVLTHCPTTAADWLTEGPCTQKPLSSVTEPAPGSPEDLLATQLTPNRGESASSRGVLGTVPPDSEGLTARGITPSRKSVYTLRVTVATHILGEEAPLRDRVLSAFDRAPALVPGIHSHCPGFLKGEMAHKSE